MPDPSEDPLTKSRDVPIYSGFVCGEAEAQCICALPPDHDGPHHCLRPTIFGIVCDGQWESDPFRIVRLPGFVDA